MHSASANSHSNLTAGFTLIEVMIVIVIIAFISVMTFRATVEAARIREQFQTETEINSELRAAYFILDRDFSQIFNPVQMLPSNFTKIDPNMPQAQAQPTASPAPGALPPLTISEINTDLNNLAFQTYEFWGPVIHESGVRASRFQGKENELSFVGNSHERVYKEKRESIFSKIHYKLVSNEKTKLQDLVKIEDTDAFAPLEQSESPSLRSVPVLTHLKRLEFSYLKLGLPDPQKNWDSEQDNSTKGYFPEAIIVNFTVIDRINREIDQEWVFRLEARNGNIPVTY